MIIKKQFAVRAARAGKTLKVAFMDRPEAEDLAMKAMKKLFSADETSYHLQAVGLFNKIVKDGLPRGLVNPNDETEQLIFSIAKAEY